MVAELRKGTDELCIERGMYRRDSTDSMLKSPALKMELCVGPTSAG